MADALSNATTSNAAHDLADRPWNQPTDRATVLVVDDDPLNRFLMAEALTLDGYHIIEASNGAEALAAARQHAPDLVLLDIDMPVMDGLAACSAIRGLPGGDMIPIMMVTGLDDVTAVDRAFHCGATDFLAKPLNWTLMRQRVRFMLRHSVITQRLLDNERLLEQVQSMALIGHWQWNLVTGNVEVSARTRDLFPYLAQQLTGVGLDWIPQHAIETVVIDAVKQSIALGRDSFVCEATVPHRQRGVLRALSRGQIFYADGKPVSILGSTQDITERHLNEERYTAIFHNSPVGIVETDYLGAWTLFEQIRTNRLTCRADLIRLLADGHGALPMPIGSRMNAAAARMLDTSDARMCFAQLQALPLDLAVAIIEAVRDSGADASLQREITHADGSVHTLVFRLPIPRNADDSRRLAISITDITLLAENEARLQRAAKIIENSNDGIMLVAKDHRIKAVNPAFARITGYTEAELIGKPAAEAMATDDPISHQRPLVFSHLQARGHFRGEGEIVRRDGTRVTLLTSISLMRDDDGATSDYVIVVTDISDLKASEQRLSHLAHFDTLTGLPNRLSLQERLESELSAKRADDNGMTLLYIDLDGFKLVNDSMGHSTGDALLSAVAARLLTVCHARDMLARIGGDEFALLMHASPEPDRITAQATRLLATLTAPFDIHERTIFIGASIGACMYPHDADNAGDMLRNADTAMYEAKRRGRGQLCFYSHTLTTESSHRLNVENALRAAIAGDELFLVYQPKFDALSGALRGAEALVRWRNPRRGVVGPAEFIGIAEESGLIVPLGEWVIGEACRQIAAWRDAFGFAHPVAINISAQHLRQRSLLQVLQNAITRHHIDPCQLEIEITEDSLDFRGEDNTPYEVLTSISEMGIAIAIDDFGTGYSSLSQLKQMPISTLKIDRSFVRDIVVDPSDHAIISAIVQLAKTLNLCVVAEGIENTEQADQLRAMHCDIFQGFLYSHPLPADRFREAIPHWPA